MSNITTAGLKAAFAAKGDKKALRAAVDAAIDAAPAEDRDQYRRHYESAFTAAEAVKDIAHEFTWMFMRQAIDAAPVAERDAVETAIDELLDSKVSKPQVKVEPRSTAEAICKDAGVPTAMADKMVVMTIS